LTHALPLLLVLVVQAPAVPLSAEAADVFYIHNYERARWGLPPLALDPGLTAHAQRHAEWMAATGRFQHSGYHPENIGAQYGYVHPGGMHAMWMHSPGHRRSILGPSRRVGVGFSRGYYCVCFGG
jgi:uncharacterized protein YkwD